MIKRIKFKQARFIHFQFNIVIQLRKPAWNQNGIWSSNHILLQNMYFYHAYYMSQNVLKSDVKKSRNCPIWGQPDPFCVQICQPGTSFSGRHDSHNSPPTSRRQVPSFVFMTSCTQIRILTAWISSQMWVLVHF